MKKNREQIKQKMSDAIAKLRMTSKDAKFTDKLINDILSYQKQLDIEPTFIHIPTKDLVKEYDNGSVKFIKTKNAIIFKALGGYQVVVTPNCTSLYEHLNILLDMKDNFDSLSVEQKETYDLLYSATFYQLIFPAVSVGSDKAFFGIATEIIKELNELTEEALNSPLQDETPIENAEFEANIDLLNKIAEEDKDA